MSVLGFRHRVRGEKGSVLDDNYKGFGVIFFFHCLSYKFRVLMSIRN